MSRRRRERA